MPPLLYCPGISPIQAATWRPLLEVVPVADAGQHRAGGDRADAGALHQALAARIVARRLGDDAVVLGDPFIELVGMGQQVDRCTGWLAGQVFQVGADVAAQAGDLLRQDDAEFGDQAAQAVVEGGAFFDKPLPRAVQAKDDLLVLLP